MKYHLSDEICIILTLFFLFILPVQSTADEIGDSENILVIYPFTEIGEWGVSFAKGFHSKITADKSFKASFYFHFLRTDVSTNDENNITVDELKELSSNHQFDVVIGILPPVHEFLIRTGDVLFPESPKLLVAAGDTQIGKIQDKELYYYIRSSSSSAIINTISDIKQMLPGLEHLYIHSGSGDSDLPYLAIFKNEVTKYFEDDILEYWVGYPVEDVFSFLVNVPDNSAIMLLTTNNDDDGKAYTSTDFFPEYSDISNAPIFSFHDSSFGLGIIGGTMTSSENYGRHAAIAVEGIVTGREYLIIEDADTSEKKYDWRQLKRWNIDLSRVPRNAKIVFTSETFWEKHKELLIISLVIFFFQTVTITLLLIQIKRGRKFRQELESKHVQISQSLKAKEILLKEVHHRVKNNLTLIISFLSLQSGSINDKTMLELLAKLQNRIHAISLVHEQLYKDDRIEQIDIAEYLKELCESVIYSSHDISTNKEMVTYDIDVESNNLSMDLMIPIGLIFNELITNSIKYAFDKITEPRIFIKGKRESNRFLFEYNDNGSGLPENIMLGNNKSLGLLIVKTLVAQIRGELRIDRSNGDKYIFSCDIDI